MSSFLQGFKGLKLLRVATHNLFTELHSLQQASERGEQLYFPTVIIRGVLHHPLSCPYFFCQSDGFFLACTNYPNNILTLNLPVCVCEDRPLLLSFIFLRGGLQSFQSVCFAFLRNYKCPSAENFVSYNFISKSWTVFRLLCCFIFCSVWFFVSILIFILIPTGRDTLNGLIHCCYLQQHWFSIINQ